MAHDRLCPNATGPCCPWMGECDCQCQCAEINEIRQDERNRWNTPYFSTDYHRGYRQAVADTRKDTPVKHAPNTELPLYAEDGDYVIRNLWVYTNFDAPIVLGDVRHDPVCHAGWWHVEYSLIDGVRAMAMIAADTVRYFAILEKGKPEAS